MILVAAGLRFYLLGGQSFWADEGNSVALAARPAGEIITAAAADIHPPAYYLLLKGWGALFGLDERGARSLSALIGVVAAGLVYLLGRRLAGERLGLLAALLAAANPFLVYYSQEARMYELLALCALVTAYATLHLLPPSPPQPLTLSPPHTLTPSALYLLFAALGLYTHYAFPLHLLALNLFFMLMAVRRWRVIGHRPFPIRHWPSAIGHFPPAFRHSPLARWLLLELAALLLYLPWLPTALRQLRAWPSPDAGLGPTAALAETLRLFTCGPIPCPASPLLPLASGLALALLLFALLPAIRTPAAETGARRPLPGSPLLLLFWLLLPLAVMLALGLYSPPYRKFLLLALPAWLLLLALGLDRLLSARFAVARLAQYAARAMGYLLLILLLLASLLSLDRYYHDPAVARDDYRSIAAYLAAVAGSDDAVILNAPGQIDAFGRYEHGAAAVYPLPRQRPPDPDATQAELDRILASHDRIYALYWAGEQADPQGLIERYLAGHSFKAWDSWVGNLRFVAYSAAPPPEPLPYTPPLRFGDSITLQAAGFSGGPLQPGDLAQVLLLWQSEGAVQQAYKVSLQLLDPADQIVAQVDAEPGGGLIPTTSWQPGQTLADRYGLPIPLATPPGSYRLILAMYSAASGERLPIRHHTGIDDHVLLWGYEVIPPPQAPPPSVLPIAHRASVETGPLTFLGHDRYKQGYGHAPDTPLEPGDVLHLTTFWRADSQPDRNYHVEIRLDGLAIGRVQPAGPLYPTRDWLPGLPWRGEHSLALPPALADGRRHRLSLQLLDPSGAPTGPSIRLSPDLIY